ncbi:MAG: hypothetical protein KDB67_00065 [Gordonia sp.]|jgi:hypothetical protein|uniref:polymorphic toxin type 50 domain-containing protein n=1 Tax=Gordonia sp. (in: high G+C Gram-positive bacteria) TaxID=84139 RepID=UPI001DB8C244|nr:polymorphic toxin type 50 domain-containing protein [Gordonia sp. (in: high G+C Gram-positive bacteria)]MCB1293068.1 hypothetical protein [Gordonia sp. (in: high G+C Gram-positive bacteria)]
MSKPRSRLISKPDHEFATVKGFTTAIHFGKQAKHLPGQLNYDATKSTITIGITRLQTLVELKAGTGRWEGRAGNKAVIDFGEVIGKHRDPKTGRSADTDRGTVHYSKTGAHVVPAAPNPRKGVHP